MNDYIPRQYLEFHKWINILISFISIEANLTRWGISANPERLTAALKDFNTKYQLEKTQKKQSPAAVIGRQDARNTLESLTKTFLKAYIIYNPDVTDEDRRNMGLPVNKVGPTSTVTITSVPEAIVKTSSPATIEIDFRSAGTKSKPNGVYGCEICGIISEIPIHNWAQLLSSYFSTHPPLKINFSGKDRGKCFYFALRWENKRREKGAWSEIYSAIIP
jgi:hypothetical protein